MKNTVLSALILVFVMLSQLSLAQNKLYVYPGTSNDLIRKIKFSAAPSVNGKKVEFNSYLGLFKDTLDNINEEHNKDYQFYSKNKFENFDSLLITDEFVIDSCTFLSTCYLQNIVANASNNDPYYKPILKIANSSIYKNIFLNSNTSIEIRNNESEYDYYIDGCKPHKLLFENNKILAGSEIAKIKNSTLKYTFLFTNNALKGSVYHFENDTITDKLFISSSNSKNPTKLFFKDCYIDCTFDAEANKSIFNCDFNGCKFGPNFKFSNSDIDVLSFINCNFASKININNNNRLLNLFVENCDFSKIEFNYNEKIKITYPEKYSKDNIKSLYENLLSKFKAEGKLESYKMLDIDYQRFNQNWLTFFLSSIWWNHGYSKYYIVFWTLIFIFIFFVFNMLKWDSVYAEYPINTAFSDISFFKLSDYALKSLLFTLVIFFAIKIDVNTIKFKSTRIVCILCLQYLIGLLCMVFIVNAILKF